MRGDAILGRAMHLASADLDLQRIAARSDHGGVDGLIAVCLRHGDIVFEAAWKRRPKAVNDAYRAVAIVHRVDDDADRDEIEDIGEFFAALQLLIDGEKVLGSAADVRFDPACGESL